MELVILEGVLGFDVAGAVGLIDSQGAVSDIPFRGGVVFGGDPLVLALAVEENDGVGGWGVVGGSGRYDGRDGGVDLGVFVLGGGGCLGGKGKGQNHQGGEHKGTRFL